MPVRYSSDLAEHHAVRTAAGIFDISHMAEISVTGPEAAAVPRLRARRQALGASPIGQAKYTLLLDATAASSTTWSSTAPRDERIPRRRERRQPRRRRRGAHATASQASTCVVDRRDRRHRAHRRAGPACRGDPRATAGLDGLDARSRSTSCAYYACDGMRLPRRTTCSSAAPATPAKTASSSSSTPDAAAELWQALTEAGSRLGLVPCGLPARDTLRLEAGMPLYGHELGLDTFPCRRDSAASCPSTKEGDFVGRAGHRGGPGRRRARARRPGRRGQARGPRRLRDLRSTATARSAIDHERRPVARPSATRSRWPTSTRVREPGTELEIDVRGSRIPASVVPLPFYKREKRHDRQDRTEVHRRTRVGARRRRGATIGITAYAAEKLGDVVFVDLPEGRLDRRRGQGRRRDRVDQVGRRALRARQRRRSSRRNEAVVASPDWSTATRSVRAGSSRSSSRRSPRS